MRKGRVLFIITCDLLRGGITSVMLNHIKNAVDYDYDLAVAGQADPNVAALFQNEGVNVHVFKKYPNVFRYAKNLIRLIKKNNYIIVHAHGSSNTMGIELSAAKRAGCMIRVAHSHNTTCTNKLLNLILKHRFNSSYTHAVACGEEAGKWLFKNKPFIISKNGIDADEFRYNESARVSCRNQLNLSENDIVLANVSMFTEAKNHKFLLEIFYSLCKTHKNYKLLLIGSGPLEHYVRDRIAELGLEQDVILLGAINNVQDWLNAIDIIVMPSLYEGFPLSLVEEQANGLRCVVSDTITRDVNLSGNVSFLPLNIIEKWQSSILQNSIAYDRAMASNSAILMIEKLGYDCRVAAKEIESMYNNAQKSEVCE